MCVCGRVEGVFGLKEMLKIKREITLRYQHNYAKNNFASIKIYTKLKNKKAE